MGEAINQALRHWPAERFPDGFRDYWDSVFSGYIEQTVADAIDAVRMESDPYVPTCDMVRRVLAEWGVSKPATRADPSWQDVLNERNRQERQAIERDHAADNAMCAKMSDEQFAELAEAVLKNLDPDVVALYRSRPLKERQSVRSLVAAHARAHGLVKSCVLEGVL